MIQLKANINRDALLVIAFCFVVASPAIAQTIPVTPETTYLTTPLAEDGYPDYKQFVLNQKQRSVDPTENGAVPFLLAVWPSGMTETEQKVVADELRIEPPQKATGFDFHDIKSEHWKVYRDRNLELMKKSVRERIRKQQSDFGESTFSEHSGEIAVDEQSIDNQLYYHSSRFTDPPLGTRRRT